MIEPKDSVNQKRTVSRSRCIFIAAMAVFLCLTAGLLCLFGGLDGEQYIYSENTKVLVYHLVSEDTYGENEYLFVRPSELEKQLQMIIERGYTTVFADELAKTKGEKCVVLTFDDGYADNYSTLLPLLRKYDMKATVFLITDMIGAEGHLTEEQIREMSESGYIRFGSHTRSHMKMSGQGSDTLWDELSGSRWRIEALTGKRVTVFAYPNGLYDENAELAVRQGGYLYAFTTDVPREVFYENTRLPRSYVVRDMPMEEFSALLD